MNALIFTGFGDTDVLQYKDLPDPVPQQGEVLVQLKAIGLNYADIYRRRGVYAISSALPYINGTEGAGIVIDSNGINGIQRGDRVCFADVMRANAEYIAIPYEHLIPLPSFISFETAAAALVQGLTAHYLTQDSYTLQAEETILIHACAGGVGQLLVQIAKAKDAYVIGLTSSQFKRDVALEAGADEVYLYTDDWVNTLQGKNVDVVYDSAGVTLPQSLEVVREGGAVVSFGFTSGNPSAIHPQQLMHASKRLIGGNLETYLYSYDERLRRSKALFNWIERGIISVAPSDTFALEDGAAAHRLLESRRSTGKIILIP